MLEAIVKLGKVLAEEQRRGCDNRAVLVGIEQFITDWQRESPDAAALPTVQQTLALLNGYAAKTPETRQQPVQTALEMLRSCYREAKGTNAKATSPPAPSKPKAAKTTKPKPQPVPLDSQAAIPLDTPIRDIPGVWRNIALSFKRLGLKTAHDLLYHFPHRYDDYSSQKPIMALVIGEVETVVGTVGDVRTFNLKRPGSTMGINVLLEDSTGELRLVFFGSQWMLKQFPVGRKIVVSGKVTVGKFGERQMSSPDWEPYSEDELIHTGRLVPVHPLTKGLHERNARKFIKLVVDRSTPLIEDYLPYDIRERVGLLSLPDALRQIHFPDDNDALEQARRRLGFDEFFFIQLGVVQRKILWQGELGFALTFHQDVQKNLLAQLPFELTNAQVQAIEQIMHDLQRPMPMARLLQGDVGSGKTLVAAAALLQAIANGLQGALMAPTEILAEQHYRGLRNILSRVRIPRDRPSADDTMTTWQEEVEQDQLSRMTEIKQLLGMTPEEDMEGEGVRVALLTGGLGKKDRRKVLEAISKGEVDLIIGTHALITESVQYHSLGLVCVDEQHRFGVEQRERLKQKGFNPHLLVMTATPIPRTLTLTVYGELDTTILDEMPPGRQKIRTRWIRRSERSKAFKHIRKEVEKGRQAFVICPLVEESEKLDLPSAEEMHTLLEKEVFPDFNIGLIHGRLLPREKDEAMRQFAAHEYDVLVATAVVEVGIDVPNATTIMIDGAERFGLAQLHQFRGRVGRGMHQSYCILISDQENEITIQRLEAMETIDDGFELAEIDLKLRGPGEFFGKRQSGTPDLKIARLADTRLLNTARMEAQKLLNDDPNLEHPHHRLLREKMQLFWKQVEGAS